jgi:hypothetical protein
MEDQDGCLGMVGIVGDGLVGMVVVNTVAGLWHMVELFRCLWRGVARVLGWHGIVWYGFGMADVWLGTYLAYWGWYCLGVGLGMMPLLLCVSIVKEGSRLCMSWKLVIVAITQHI